MKDVFVYEDYTGSFLYMPSEKKYRGKIEGINKPVYYQAESIMELGDQFQQAVREYIASQN